MRHALSGIGICVLVCFALIGLGGQRISAQPQQPVPPSVKPLVLSDGLIALSSDTADGQQQVTVIDSKTRVMSVYHVNHQSGAIALKSVRNLSADLLMDEFNTESPLPRDIRAILNKR